MTPKVRHVWMLDNRSLCDRSARPPVRTDPREKLLLHDEYDTAPGCGACIAAFELLRHDLALITASASSIYPSTGDVAIRALEDTRWGREMDLEILSSGDHRLIRMTHVAELRYDPGELEGAIQRDREDRAAARSRLVAEVADCAAKAPRP